MSEERQSNLPANPSSTVADAERTQPARPKTPFEQVNQFLLEATVWGRFPLVAYAVGDDGLGETDGHSAEGLPPVPAQETDAGDEAEEDAEALREAPPKASAEQRVRVLTTSIADLALAIRILEETTFQGYNLGKRLWPGRLLKLKEENPHVFVIHEECISGIGPDKISALGKMIRRFGAPLMREKGFALVDICGFSRLDAPQQLSCLYSLTNLLDTAISRSRQFCNHLAIHGRFGRNSTGDGYYFWHDGPDGRSDAATFMALLCLMTQCEVMRRAGFPMQLKCAFVVDSAFLFYDAKARSDPYAVASNAIGAATNGAARLVSAAKPGQILVGDFERPGQADEILNSQGLLAHANQLFREEGSGAASLSFSPADRLRVTGKHGDIWYCYNVSGRVPHKVKERNKENVIRVAIGLEKDESRSMDSLAFAPSSARKAPT